MIRFHGAPFLIFRVWCLAPSTGFSLQSQTPDLKGLIMTMVLLLLSLWFISIYFIIYFIIYYHHLKILCEIKLNLFFRRKEMKIQKVICTFVYQKSSLICIKLFVKKKCQKFAPQKCQPLKIDTSEIKS